MIKGFEKYDNEDIILMIILAISVICGIVILVSATTNVENNNKNLAHYKTRTVHEVIDSLYKVIALAETKELKTKREKIVKTTQNKQAKTSEKINHNADNTLPEQEKPAISEKFNMEKPTIKEESNTIQTIGQNANTSTNNNETHKSKDANNNLNKNKYADSPSFVDLGLSIKWATRNIGAESIFDTGSYFAWGELSTKTNYSISSSKTHLKNIKDFSGNTTYDIATSKLGAKYRIPTKKEFDELKNKCKWEWVELGNNKYGYKVIGPNGNSILLPAAGYIDGSSKSYVGSIGQYWTSTPNGAQGAEFFSISKNERSLKYDHRYKGKSIRAVTK